MAYVCQNFRFLKFNLRYVPYVAATQAGMGVLTVLTGSTPKESVSFSSLASYAKAHVFSVREPTPWFDMLPIVTQQYYHMSPRHGVDSVPFHIVGKCDTGATVTTTMGQIWADYKIEFVNHIVTPDCSPCTAKHVTNLTFNAAQPAAGDTTYYVHDYGTAQSTPPTAVSILEDYNSVEHSFDLIKGMEYFLVDMNSVDQATWATAKRYYGIAKEVGGALMTHHDPASTGTMALLTEVYKAAENWSMA